MLQEYVSCMFFTLCLCRCVGAVRLIPGLLRALHSTILKTFVIRAFFRGKWLLTHVLGGSGGQEISCKQACVDF